MGKDLEEAIAILRDAYEVVPQKLADRIKPLLARHPEKPKLLPCPLCDSGHVGVTKPEGTMEAWREVRCDDCGLQTGTWANEESAVFAWNRSVDKPRRW